MTGIRLRLGIVLLCVIPARCFADEVSADVDTQGVAEAALDDSVWYDAEAKEIVPVEVREEFDDTVHRNSRWLPKPKKVAKPNSVNAPVNPTGGGPGNGLFGSDFTLGNLFGWFLIIVILVTAVGLLIYAFIKADIELDSNSVSKSTQNHKESPDEQTIERMKHLPAELRRTDVNMRSEAERLMKEGLYDQAIILLFGHQLLLLDRAGMLRLNRGKTNGKYIRETRAIHPEAGTKLKLTVSAFERSYFGRHEIAQREFAEIWRSNLDLEKAIEIHQGMAA